jgi:spermidine synthase
MAWVHVDSAALGDSVLDLYERDGVHMIRVDGWELMNGEYHESEDRLGELAARLARRPDPAILVGGLGLGFTLASLVRHLGGAGRVTVAELSDAVIRWFDRHTRPPSLGDHPARIRHGDVLAVAAEGPAYDVILLDVDNGPQPLSAPSNAALYGSDGLCTLRRALAPDGILMVWSAFEDPDFLARARSAGFFPAWLPVFRPGRAEPFHLVYVLSATPFTPDELDSFGLQV